MIINNDQLGELTSRFTNQTVIGDLAGISQPAVSVTIQRVSEVLAEHVATHIKYPQSWVRKCLQRGITTKVETALVIICATAVLHNLAQPGIDDANDDDNIGCEALSDFIINNPEAMKRSGPSGSQKRKIKKARAKVAELLSGSLLKYINEKKSSNENEYSNIEVSGQEETQLAGTERHEEKDKTPEVDLQSKKKLTTTIDASQLGDSSEDINCIKNLCLVEGEREEKEKRALVQNQKKEPVLIMSFWIPMMLRTGQCPYRITFDLRLLRRVVRHSNIKMVHLFLLSDRANMLKDHNVA
nr:unnamed protein product [Callosobruchus analis]